MNDFTDIENELKKLQPRQPSARLFESIEQEFAGEAVAERGIGGRCHNWWRRFTETPYSIGIGLAAAALILVFLHFDFQSTVQQRSVIASNSPSPQARAAITDNGFVPSAATQVVYHMRDEGLVFPSNSEAPVRRMRSFTHETLQWRNAATGASLRVSYPAEQVEWIPVSGQ